jgi:hypothetical protein
LDDAGTAAATSSSPGFAWGARVEPGQTVADSAALERERKTVTALFADINAGDYGSFPEFLSASQCLPDRAPDAHVFRSSPENASYLRLRGGSAVQFLRS